MSSAEQRSKVSLGLVLVIYFLGSKSVLLSSFNRSFLLTCLNYEPEYYSHNKCRSSGTKATVTGELISPDPLLGMLPLGTLILVMEDFDVILW